MATFGVHSEVGKLRQVIVHRPELSLKRLTPDNHDELLFDDVLWVERAQWEHDQFVARMRERGTEVFYVQDLLGEALAAAIPIESARGEPTEPLEQLLQRVMRFLLRQQWSRENCFACASSEVIGGMSEHTHSSLTRIDFAQHAWAALGHGRRALGDSPRER